MMHRPNRDYALALMADTAARIHVNGEITRENAGAIFHAVRAARFAGALDVYVDSPGGDVASAFDIYDAIRAHEGDVTTHGVGAVHSAAALIFMAGRTRRLHPDATVLLHSAGAEPTSSVDRWTARDHDRVSGRLARIDKGIAAYFAERTGKPAVVFESEMRDEKFTPHSRCLQLKIATELVR